MGVSTVVTATQTSTPVAGRSGPRSIDSLCNTMDKICTKVAKLEISGCIEKQQYNQTDWPNRNTRCFSYNNYGHFAWECWQSRTNRLRRDILDILVAKAHRSAWLAPALELLLNCSPLYICGKTDISVNNVLAPILVSIAKHLPHDMILGYPPCGEGVVI